MKTKEEILIEFGCPEIPFDENVKMYYPAILSAMDEYASQYREEIQRKDEEIQQLRTSAEVSANMFGDMLNKKSEVHKEVERLKEEITSLKADCNEYVKTGTEQNKRSNKLNEEIERLKNDNSERGFTVKWYKSELIKSDNKISELESELVKAKENRHDLFQLAWATASAYGDNTNSSDFESWYAQNVAPIETPSNEVNQPEESKEKQSDLIWEIIEIGDEPDKSIRECIIKIEDKFTITRK